MLEITKNLLIVLLRLSIIHMEYHYNRALLVCISSVTFNTYHFKSFGQTEQSFSQRLKRDSPSYLPIKILNSVASKHFSLPASCFSSCCTKYRFMNVGCIVYLLFYLRPFVQYVQQTIRSWQVYHRQTLNLRKLFLHIQKKFCFI